METWFWILGWILSILTIAGNGFTVLLVGIQRRLRTKTNALIVSLAVADFCVGVFAVPSLFFCEIRGGCNWPQPYASWVEFTRWLFACASIMNLCSLVLDRYTSSRVCITVSNSPNPSHVYIKLLCGQGLIMACMQSVFNKLELETCTFSSNLQWMFYFKNQCVSGSLRCSSPTYLLDHWYNRVLNRFLGIRDFPYLRLGIGDYKAKSGQDSGLKVC